MKTIFFLFLAGFLFTASAGAASGQTAPLPAPAPASTPVSPLFSNAVYNCVKIMGGAYGYFDSKMRFVMASPGDPACATSGMCFCITDL